MTGRNRRPSWSVKLKCFSTQIFVKACSVLDVKGFAFWKVTVWISVASLFAFIIFEASNVIKQNEAIH